MNYPKNDRKTIPLYKFSGIRVNNCRSVATYSRIDQQHDKPFLTDNNLPRNSPALHIFHLFLDLPDTRNLLQQVW